MGKSWYKSKLMWLGAGQVVGGVGKFLADNDPTDLITAFTGLLTIILRAVTKQPLSL